jgi:hypothetical protein
MGLRILAMVLRALFIGALVVVTVRISSPQSETISTVYESPGLIRHARTTESQLADRIEIGRPHWRCSETLSVVRIIG